MREAVTKPKEFCDSPMFYSFLVYLTISQITAEAITTSVIGIANHIRFGTIIGNSIISAVLITTPLKTEIQNAAAGRTIDWK